MFARPYTVYKEYLARGGAAYSSHKLASLMRNNLKPEFDQEFSHPLMQFEERLPDHPKCKVRRLHFMQNTHVVSVFLPNFLAHLRRRQLPCEISAKFCVAGKNRPNLTVQVDRRNFFVWPRVCRRYRLKVPHHFNPQRV